MSKADAAKADPKKADTLKPRLPRGFVDRREDEIAAQHRMLERIRDELSDVALVEQFPKLEGRQMIMVLAPKKKQ